MKKKILVTLLLLIIALFVVWYGYKEQVKNWAFWSKKEVVTITQ